MNTIEGQTPTPGATIKRGATPATKLASKIEWSLITAALADRTRSPLGLERARNHMPYSNAKEAEALRTRVAEAALLLSGHSIHALVSDIEDCTKLFERASREGILTPSEISSCGQLIEAVSVIGEQLRGAREMAPSLARDFDVAPKMPVLCTRIRESVTRTGEILDSASELLRGLRRSRAVRRADFESNIASRIKDWYEKGLLQDNFYDIVDGRFVVPVKVEMQNQIDGSLVSRSNTGQSVYVEPVVLMRPSNELKEIELQIRAEEQRILRELSGEIGTARSQYEHWIPVLAELDLIFAAAVLAKDWDLEQPAKHEATNNATELALNNVFHPGLKLRNIDIVTNDLALRSGGEALLISGPNTGGKTVLLKAVGMAAEMARAGLFIGAADGSQIPHYADVIALIGDDQSIAAGLSSFSAQILELKQLLDRKGSGNGAPLLVIIDEILSSTNPEEASALAQAVIEELVERGDHVLVSSHFSDLSVRAREHAKITVAAMEFDAGRPTYRLRVGELGSSHALEVAEQLGFSEKLLTRAKNLMSSVKLDYEKALAALKDRESELELDLERRLTAAQREHERNERALKTKLEFYAHETAVKFEKALSEIKARLKAPPAAPVTRGAVPANHQAPKPDLAKSSKSVEKVADAVKDLASAFQSATDSARTEIQGEKPKPKPHSFAPQDRVRVLTMNRSEGVILKITGTGAAARAQIQVGGFRLERPLDDLEWIAPNAQERHGMGKRSSYVGIETSDRVPLKCDLRGKRFDDAIAEAERYLDLAFRSGMPSVTVITGHGTGAIKSGVKALLSDLPYIRQVTTEREGDDGAFRVEFDR